VSRVKEDEWRDSRTQSDSKDGNAGMVTLLMLRYERCITATPPPRPIGLGL